MRRNIIITAAISVVMVLLGVFVFSDSYLRLWESFCDLGNSAAYYFCELFGIKHSITATVNGYSEVFSWGTVLPEDFNDFKECAADYFLLLFDAENFAAWGKGVAVFLETAGKVLMLSLPCIVALVFMIRKLYKKGNENHGKDTVPLKVFKTMTKYTYQPVKRTILSYLDHIRAHKPVWGCWLAAWAFHLNLVTIVTEFIAYYLWFVVSFGIVTVYIQVNKLLIDLQVIIKHFPWWSIATAAYILFTRWRKRIARSRLRHYEARNCGFINELPIVSMSCGSMGKKKTTVITDMALSQEVMFRQKAHSILQNNDMKFPHFPWICFEKALQKCMEYDRVYNLATVKEWVKLKRQRFEGHGNAVWQLYGYDVIRYGYEYNDGLKTSDLFDVLETYAQAYFIYVIQSSLIVSNYSVRTDNAFIDTGNFPIWLTDFFPEQSRETNRHSHVLDFDVLRLGKKVMENNPKAGSFEFGVVGITEIGKERGNNLELKEVKKGTDEANQKNDLFNAWLKMCRHSAMVDHFPFIKVFTDEQRPESWGADARELCEVLHIISSGEQKLTLPLYTIEEMISEWAFNRFLRLYEDFRFRRGDNTLLVHVLKSITAWLWKRNVRVYNRYGYCILKIEKERGTMDGKTENKKYYLMNAKIYANRFSTDCFSDYFNDMAKKSKIGLMDYIEYSTEKASVEELKSQNSYFMNALYKDNGA
jgi:hypothetical protein